MQIQTTSKGSVIKVQFDDVASGWEQWVMLTSDRHHDNPRCRRDLELDHLEKAKERNAIIIDAGDMFCAMQGKYDPRRSMDDVRPEDVGADYLDRIVIHAAEFYGPYAEHFLVIGQGNHETAVLNHNGTSLTSNLVHRLNSDYGGSIHIGKYGGWVRFAFRINKTKHYSSRLRYHHGYGGGAPVTRGAIQTNRQAVYQPDANIILNGHDHNGWIIPIARARLSDGDIPYKDILYFLRTPGYKDEYGDGSEGFRVEKGGDPKPQGCIWLRFTADQSRRNNQMPIRIRCETDFD
jgi:hypothetical protein